MQNLRRVSMQSAHSVGNSADMDMALQNQLLKEDDDLLRLTFLQIFKHHHPQLANKVDTIFALAQVSRGPRLPVIIPRHAPTFLYLWD
jgi:hypothetical protein